MTHPTIISEDTLTVFLNSEPYLVEKTHPYYEKIVKAINKGKSAKKIIKLIDKTEAIKNYLSSSTPFRIIDGVIYYKGEPTHNVIADKVIQMFSEGFDIEPMFKFMQNLQDNPSYSAQQELYLFLEAGSLPITEDGCFLAYKSVNSNYRDYYSWTFDNSIGSICEVARSCGMHASPYEYAISFGGSNSHLMVLKINPRDVVSIPKDYNNAKLRCCRYEVIGETSRSNGQEIEKRAVYELQ
jgi:hypothetical protein